MPWEPPSYICDASGMYYRGGVDRNNFYRMTLADWRDYLANNPAHGVFWNNYALHLSQQRLAFSAEQAERQRLEDEWWAEHQRKEKIAQQKARETRARNRATQLRHITMNRPIDMGGPRDVWLTFFPSPDPRLDNMMPVDAFDA